MCNRHRSWALTQKETEDSGETCDLEQRSPSPCGIFYSPRFEIISLPSSTNASDITQGKEKWKTFSLVRRNHLFEMVSSASPRRNYGALPRLVSSSSSECRLSIFGFPCKQLRVSPLEDCRRSLWRTGKKSVFLVKNGSSSAEPGFVVALVKNVTKMCFLFAANMN